MKKLDLIMFVYFLSTQGVFKVVSSNLDYNTINTNNKSISLL